ncbi:hypothetical protein GYMLUDRAFT_174646, partial [Collybiopsis luxurians FD-317 M1]
LDSSVWIWTNENPVSGQNYPPNTARAFRYTMTLPDGHTSGTATAMIVADDEYSLYINGHFIGTGTVFNVAQQFVADVQGPEIVIAVYAVNTQTAPTPAGVLASIQVVSQDGYCGGCSSTTSVLSGTSWKAFPGTIPSGFEQPGFDDSAWPAAGSEGQNGAPGTRATPALSFATSDWIWTTELSGGTAPVGSRGFRKTFVLPEGKTPASLSIVFAVDDEASLWVNGDQVVTNQVGWTNPAATCVNLYGCQCALLIAFNATNTGGPAGLLVSALVTYTDGSTSPIISDGSWRASTGGIPGGFQNLSFDDSTWALVVTEGGNGVSPWGNIQISGANPPTCPST